MQKICWYLLFFIPTTTIDAGNYAYEAWGKLLIKPS